MTLRAQLIMVALAVAGFGSVLWLVRRRSLKERFALLWLAIGIGMLVLVAAPGWLDRLSIAVGIRSGTSTLFLLAILFLLGLILHLSVIISGLEEKVRRLTEVIGLLGADMEELESAQGAPSIDVADDSSQPTGE